MALFDTHIVVDWSARSKPSPAKPTRDAIFWAVARAQERIGVHYARTRAAARTRLTDLLLAERAAGRRVLVGFDFPFGYPRGVAQRLSGVASALALWEWLAARIQDASDNANNRFAVAEEINRAFAGIGPMWGRPASWDHPDVPTQARARQGAHPPEWREVEAQTKGAKSLWQLAYAGSVGSQTLLGIPTLKHLRDRLQAQVWPFDTGFQTPSGDLVLAEIYPSLLQPQAHANRQGDEPLDASQVRTLASAFARLDGHNALAPLFAPQASEAAATEEGWILGSGHAALLAQGQTP